MITHPITKTKFLSPQMQHACTLIGATLLVVCVSAGWLKYLSFPGTVTAGVVGAGLVAIALANQRQVEAVRRSPLLVQRREFRFEGLGSVEGAVYLDEEAVACIAHASDWSLAIWSSADPQRRDKIYERVAALSKQFIVTGQFGKLEVWPRKTGARVKEIQLSFNINKIRYDGSNGLIYVYAGGLYSVLQEVVVYDENIDQVAQRQVEREGDILVDLQRRQWHFNGYSIEIGDIKGSVPYPFLGTRVDNGHVSDRKQVVNGKAYYIGSEWNHMAPPKKQLCVIDVVDRQAIATVVLKDIEGVWDFYICGNRVVIAIEKVGVVLFDLEKAKPLELLDRRPAVSFGYFKGKVLSYWDFLNKTAVWLTLPDRLAPTEVTSLEKL